MPRFNARWLLLCVAFLFAAPAMAQGRFDHYPAFASKFVAARDVTVWLPEGYDSKTPLPVIYMQDNQQLWDASKTWNREAWGVADTMTRLIKDCLLYTSDAADE